MSKTFVDKNLLVWEAYPSTGAFGYPENPKIVFNCLTNRMMRPRLVEFEGDEAGAEAAISRSSSQELLQLFETAKDLG